MNTELGWSSSEVTLGVPSQHLVTAAYVHGRESVPCCVKDKICALPLGTVIVNGKTGKAVETRVGQHPHTVSGRGVERLVSHLERVDSL